MGKFRTLCIALVLTFIMLIAACRISVKASEFKLSWISRTPMPTARAQAAVVVGDDGKIYVNGGYNETGILDVVEAYNPSTDSWETKTPMPEAVRCAAATKGLDGLIYVISGYNGDYVPTVQVYNTTSDTWSTKADITFPVLFAGATTSNDGKIYIVGGTEPSDDTNKLQIYDPATDTWSLGASMLLSQTQQGVVKDKNGFIYSIGGQTWTPTPGALSFVQVYDPYSETWLMSTSMFDGRNEFGAVLAVDGRIYAIGGGKNYANNSPPFFNTVMVFDPLTRAWSFDANMLTPRKELGAVAIGESIYTIGGCNGTYLSIVEETKIAMPNSIPTAYIDSVTPNSAIKNQEVTLAGHGTDTDGTIMAYKWRSSIDGVIGNQASISVSSLSNGTHTLYFSVQDDDGTWSTDAVATLTVENPITDDPLYQKVENLTSKLDDLTLQLLALGLVTIILIIITIVMVYMMRKKTTPPTTLPSTPSPQTQ